MWVQFRALTQMACSIAGSKQKLTKKQLKQARDTVTQPPPHPPPAIVSDMLRRWLPARRTLLMPGMAAACLAVALPAVPVVVPVVMPVVRVVWGTWCSHWDVWCFLLTLVSALTTLSNALPLLRVWSEGVHNLDWTRDSDRQSDKALSVNWLPHWRANYQNAMTKTIDVARHVRLRIVAQSGGTALLATAPLFTQSVLGIKGWSRKKNINSPFVADS